MLVVAAVIAELQRLDGPGLVAAVEQMLAAMRLSFAGSATQEVESAASDALLPTPDDDAVIEALRSFVHVSRRSDQFGFDVLGWLVSGNGDQEPGPVFLEVKSTSTTASGRRSFKVSTHEWEIATDSRSAPYYAFCLVGRSPSGVPTMELLAHPASIKQPEELLVDTDAWALSYAVDRQAV